MKNLYLATALCSFVTLTSFGQQANNSLFFGNPNFAQEKFNASVTNTDAAEPIAINEAMEAHYRSVSNRINTLKKGVTAAAVPSTGTNYDVTYYRLNLRINPDTTAGKYVRGNVTIYYKTTTANTTNIRFDMATTLTTDSVYYRGAKLSAASYIRPTDLIVVNIPNVPTAGTLDSITIFYKGVPPIVPDFGGATGYRRTTHNTTTPQNYVYTLSEPYSSFTWWPTKSFVVNDKADSADIIVSTLPTFKVAANGKLVHERTLGPNSKEMFWKVRYPIAAYQICLSVAKYVQQPTTPTMVNVGGTMMPYFNYLFPETNTAAAQTSLNRVPSWINTFGTLFGDYPFKNEKYGNYSFGFGGGMEHNTFSGEGTTVYDGVNDWSTLSHELAHQWWGASVTCGSWKDIWINESFANYSEVLILEFDPTLASSVGTTALADRTAKQTSALSTTNQAQTTFRADTSSMTTIFSPSVYIYNRGAMLVSMMRTMMGDTKFFLGLQKIQSNYKTSSAYTNDIKDQLEAVSGLDFTAFFNDWFYNTGFATYNTATWNNFGNTIVLRLPQVTQSSSISHFDMPIAVRIQGATAAEDTTVTIYDQGGVLYYLNDGVVTPAYGNNSIQYDLSFTPTTVTYDPLDLTLSTGAFTKSAALVLDNKLIDFSCFKNKNNVNIYWSIDNSFTYNNFIVEKSVNGVDFAELKTIKAADNAGIYNFMQTDVDVATGVWYYRIKVVQKDGNVIYTNTLPVTITSNAPVYSVTPNPAKDVITISSREKVESVDISIYSATGNRVATFKNKQLNGQSIKLVVSNLSPGTYYVKIRKPGQEEAYTKSIVIIP
jgi:hypothetical protein